MRRGKWIVIGMVCLAPQAQAAPWSQSPGGWYTRALISNEQLGEAEGLRTDLYGEIGLPGRRTLTAKHEAVRYEGAAPAFDRESYRFTLRQEFMRTQNGWSMGGEVGAVHGNTVAGILECRGWGGEARMSLGKTGKRQGRPFYLFSDLVHIQHEDGCLRQRVEMGYGADWGRNFFSIQQAWVEQGNRTADSVKLESRIGYRFPVADFSIGYREEIKGAFEESALLIAITARR